MINDVTLQLLTDNIAERMATALSADEPLRKLDSLLNNSAVDGSDLEFEVGPVHGTVVRSHLLLCRQPTFNTVHLPLASIFGAGKYYDGSLGRGDAFREALGGDLLSRTLETQDIAPGPVAQRVMLCLQFLKSSATYPKVREEVQRHLSTLMLRYPVLLDPRILLPGVVAATGRTEYRSLAATLAMTAWGALPRYRHFRSAQADAESGVDKNLLHSLTAFAKHPCVQKAMYSHGLRLRAERVGQLGKVVLKQKRETLPRALITVLGPRPAFLASVMELEEIAKPRAVPRLPWNAVVAPNAQLREQVSQILAKSFAAAAGTVRYAVLQDQIPMARRSDALDFGFLDCIERRRTALFGDRPQDSELMAKVLSATAVRIFLSAQDEPTPGEVRHNVIAATNALTRTGLCTSTCHAAELLLESCLGARRYGEAPILPRAETTVALAFLKAIDELGAFGDSDEATRGTLDRLKASIANSSGPAVQNWLGAAGVFTNDKLMRLVIYGPGTNTDLPIADGKGGESSPLRGRRARASL